MYSANLHTDGNVYTLGVSTPSNQQVVEISQYKVEGATAHERFKDFTSNNELIKKISTASETFFFSTSSKMTLIPAPFFEKDTLSALISSIILLEEKDKIKYNFIPEIDSYLVFTIHELTENAIRSALGSVHFKHHFSSLLSTYYLHYAAANEQTAFVQYHDQKFSLCLFNGKKLTHFNVFDIASFEDVIYYTYYTMEQFQFTPKNTVIHIGGNYSGHEQVLSTFQKYSERIYRLKPKKEIQLSAQEENAFINTIFDIQCG